MNAKFKINLTDDQEPIIALSTPRGTGAIALIRLSGVGVFEVLDLVSTFESKSLVTSFPSHTIHHGFIVDHDNNQIIDEVLFFLMRGPKTFTGQDVIEIGCHNNQFIIEKIITLICKNGARHARAGEFSRRAVLAGKINLLQAEAINELINAQNELALKKSMEQVSGTLSNFLMQLEQRFVDLLGVVEASFEFLVEEQEAINFGNIIKQKCIEITRSLNVLKLSFNQQQQMRDGIRIALLGVVNAGKSTLFNALLGKDRAIVSDVAGTTRDSIESSIYKNGNFWTFIDTAGVRHTTDAVEQAGIQRSICEAEKADLILLVIDFFQESNAEQLAFYQKILDKHSCKIIVVLNKIDKVVVENSFVIKHNCIVRVSAERLVGVDKLFSVIDEKVQKMIASSNSSFLLNQRQVKLIGEISVKFDFIVSNLLNTLEYELVAYNIKEILTLMSELMGRGIEERVLDSVFNNFCVGK